jgi:hypothetical protein
VPDLKSYDTPKLTQLGQIDLPTEPPTIEQIQHDWLLMMAAVQLMTERIKRLEDRVSAIAPTAHVEEAEWS